MFADMFADFTMGHALFYYFLVTLVALPILFLSWLGQKYRIEKMRNELQALRAAQTAASKKIDNAKLSLQTFERDLKSLQKNLAE